MTPTIEGFAAFVREQPADRRLRGTHWGSSVVGNYIESVGGHRSRARWFANNVIAGYPELYQDLNHYEIETYGQLQTALEEAGL